MAHHPQDFGEPRERPGDESGTPGALEALEADDFEGLVHGAESSGAPPASQAFFHGSVIMALWPRSRVRRLLPDIFEPAPHPALPDRHPVLFLLGDQRQGTVIYGGVTYPSRLVYQEFTMAVPFVRDRRRDDLHVYLPRMISSFPPAVLTGNRAYGFSKRSGHLERDGPLWEVLGAQGELLVRAHVEPDPPGDATASRRFDVLRRWFELPITGVRSDGRWVSSYWCFDVSSADIRSARAELGVEEALATGVVRGASGAAVGGAFEVAGLRWVLSWPLWSRS